MNIENSDELLAYLRMAGLIDEHETPQIRVLSGGVSNRTVLVERNSGEAWVLKQALSKLRVPVDWFSSPERVHREALGLRWLTRLAPPGSLPGYIHEDWDEHLLIMQAVPQPHANWKTVLLSGHLDLAHVRQFGELLAAIHRGSAQRRAEVAPVFQDRSFFESLRLEPYFGYSATQVPAAADFLHALMDDVRSRQITLVHGDYSPKNVLVHQDRLVLLDHEVIHFGDPAFDLGFSLTHFLSKAHHLPRHRQAFADAAVYYWQVYRQSTGSAPWSDGVEIRAVHHTLACMLARVAGRSPLEYLSPAEQERQQRAVLALMNNPPASVPSLVQRFIQELTDNAND